MMAFQRRQADQEEIRMRCVGSPGTVPPYEIEAAELRWSE
jgi:hypothetical protein